MTSKQPAQLVLLGLLLAGTLSAQEGQRIARDYYQAHGPKILRDFSELLSIPNVAADSINIRRNAQYLQGQFSRRGVSAELLELPDTPPIVYGELLVPGAKRTLILYVHYDGQPVNSSQWTNPPWEPTLYSNSLEADGRRIDWPTDGGSIDPEWRIYGRSAGDDKAPIPAILAALDALRESGLEPTSNLKFFFEGEEEAGSQNLARYLEKYQDRLAADIWLFCDGPVHQSRTPQLVFGVRGIVGLEITVYGAKRYLHSGHYGNWSPNPALLLAQLLGGMKDDEANVLIEGFYDSVTPLSAEETEILAALPDYDRELRRELGLAATENGNQNYFERLLLPSLNIRGFVSATVGPSARNIIPPEATASIDIRLVKGNDPEEMLDLFEAHVRRMGYHIVREDPDSGTRRRYPRIARIVRRHGYPAARTQMNLPIATQIIAAARRATDGEVLLVPSLGGSLPLYLFTDKLEKPVIITPIANHDDNQHAPDENLRIANLWYGIELMTEIFRMP